jgi:hypothetical protein
VIIVRIKSILDSGKLRIDIREYLGDRPLRKGIRLTPEIVPAIVRVLETQENLLIDMGYLELGHYRALGLIPPRDLVDDS